MKFKKTTQSNIFQDVSSDIYYWREQINGKRYFKSTGKRSLGQARAVVRDLRSKALGGEIDSLRRKWSDLFEAAITKKSDKSEKTIKEAESQYRRMSAFFEEEIVFLDKFLRSHTEWWLNYKTYAYAKNMEKHGKRGKLWHDRKFLIFVLNVAFENGWSKKKFASSDFSLNERTDPVGKYLDSDDVSKLISAIKDMEDDSLLSQVEIALSTGMRKSEILGLSIGEVDLKRQEILLPSERVKTRRGRTVPIPINLEELFRKLVSESKKSKTVYLFPARTLKGEIIKGQHQTDLTKRWFRAKKAAEIDVRFHDLRHTCATNLISKGMPAIVVSQFLGMSVDVLNKIYAKINKDMKAEFRSILSQ